MAKYQISDIPSATLLMDTDSIDEAFEFIESIIDDEGVNGLEDLSISGMISPYGPASTYSGVEIMLYIQSLKAQQEARSRGIESTRSPERERWILRLIAWGNGQFPWTQVVVTKGAFLLSRSNLDFEHLDYEFVPHNFGPYTPVVQRDLDMLVSQRLLRMEAVAGSSARRYHLTQWGRVRVSELEHDVSFWQRQEIEQVATRVTGKYWVDMLVDLYEEFPEMAVNSTLRRPKT